MIPIYGTDAQYDAWIDSRAEQAEAAAEQRYSAQREMDAADREARQAMTTLYVIQTTDFGGDVAGYVMAPDGEVIYSHISSSMGWLKADLTSNFGRDDALRERFGDYTVRVVGLNDPLPPEIAHHFKSADGDPS